jgi:hypothetical protein
MGRAPPEANPNTALTPVDENNTPTIKASVAAAAGAVRRGGIVRRAAGRPRSFVWCCTASADAGAGSTCENQTVSRLQSTLVDPLHAIRSHWGAAAGWCHPSDRTVSCPIAGARLQPGRSGPRHSGIQSVEISDGSALKGLPAIGCGWDLPKLAVGGCGECARYAALGLALTCRLRDPPTRVPGRILRH